MADRIRLQLDQRRAQAVHAAITEALRAHLLVGDRRDAAQDVLDRLDRRVPGWLETAPVGGEAGYLIAARAVLRALVDAEDRGLASLSEAELLRELGEAKPLGATAADVFSRMRREHLITARPGFGGERWWTAARAGRQLLWREPEGGDSWRVEDADQLLELIYAEHRAGSSAYRRCVRAIGHLEDDDLEPLIARLVADGLLEPPGEDRALLSLTWTGLDRAKERFKDSAPPGTYRSILQGPPPRPLPYRRDLPIRIQREDRLHPGVRWRADGTDGFCRGSPASWLQSSSKTRLWATLRRAGAVTWQCRTCEGHWLVYLQAHTPDDRPAYRNPADATHNRPAWRPIHRP